MFNEFIYNLIRFVNGLLSVGIEKQISHISKVVVNTSIKVPKKSLSSNFQVFHDHTKEKKIIFR
jgi:hypothetical protein